MGCKRSKKSANINVTCELTLNLDWQTEAKRIRIRCLYHIYSSFVFITWYQRTDTNIRFTQSYSYLAHFFIKRKLLKRIFLLSPKVVSVLAQKCHEIVWVLLFSTNCLMEFRFQFNSIRETTFNKFVLNCRKAVVDESVTSKECTRGDFVCLSWSELIFSTEWPIQYVTTSQHVFDWESTQCAKCHWWLILTEIQLALYRKQIYV